MKDLFSRLRRWITDRLNSVEVWIVRHTPGAGKPWTSPVHHAVVTVIGLMPYYVPGPVGIALWWFTGWPWLWLAASAWTWIWYLDRELRQHGGRIPWKLDPILDVAVPALALNVLGWLLLK